MYLATMADDEEMRSYLQLCLGYTITGETKEEIVLVFTGQGRNTKGTTMQTMKKCLGDFMGTMNNGIIIRRTGGNMDAERARLQGLRVALFNELGDGEVLNTAELQMLSGSDGVTIKRLYCDPTEIETPTHKCILTTNHSPTIPLKEVTTSIVERLIIINFGVTFTDLEEGEEPTVDRRQCDKTLKFKLAGQLHVYLKWLVQGAVRYYQEGGKIKQKAPKKVKDATNAYFEKQNTVKQFVETQCTRGNTSEFFEEVEAFFTQFQTWKPENSEVNKANFVFGLKQLGIVSKQVRIRGTPVRESRYHGIRLRSVESLEEGPSRYEAGNIGDGI
jgi:putative DNA primase/helicase